MKSEHGAVFLNLLVISGLYFYGKGECTSFFVSSIIFLLQLNIVESFVILVIWILRMCVEEKIDFSEYIKKSTVSNLPKWYAYTVIILTSFMLFYNGLYFWGILYGLAIILLNIVLYCVKLKIKKYYEMESLKDKNYCNCKTCLLVDTIRDIKPDMSCSRCGKVIK